MKRFLAFGYDDYYPSGGKHDFRGDFDSIEAAVNADPRQRYGNLDVLDTATGKWACFISRGGDPWQRYLEPGEVA